PHRLLVPFPAIRFRRDRSPATAADRAPWIAALIMLAILILTRGRSAPVGVFYDDGIYFDLARALAAGHGYRHDALPGAPAGVHYPPLYPLWLVLWSWLRVGALGVGTIAWLKLGNMLLAAAAVVPWSRWGIRRLALHPLVATSVVAAGLLIVPARAVTSTLFSEPLGWLMLGLALDAAGEDDDVPRAGSVARSALAGLLAIERSIFLPFALAAAWHAVRRRAWRVPHRVLHVALCLAPAVLWWAWTARHAASVPEAWRSSYGSYTGMWTASWHAVRDLTTLAAHQGASLWGTATRAWTTPGAVFALLACAAGLWRLRAVSAISCLGTLGYLAIVLLWPAQPDRFIWGILPLLMLLGALGAAWVLDAMARLRDARIATPARLALAAALLLPTATCTRVTIAGYRHDGWLAPQWNAAGAYAPLVAWARHLPPDVIVLAPNDPLFANATGRRAAPALPPDLREDAGAPAALSAAARAERSACTVGRGWFALPDTTDATSAAVRALRADARARVRFGPPERVGPLGLAIPFTCVDAATAQR
ncbi:MAG: hypothetical protein IRY91_11785, partial [Gemmatimonadaceae bacterium]|nr:hypothetical protein [Gemmatimonadaceae bacterium]